MTLAAPSSGSVFHTKEQHADYSRHFREVVKKQCELHETSCATHEDAAALFELILANDVATAAITAAEAKKTRIIREEFKKLYGAGAGDCAVSYENGEIQIAIGGDNLMYESNSNNLFPIISFFSKDKRLRLDLPLYALSLEHAFLKRVREEDDDDDDGVCADADQYEDFQIIKIRQISDVVQQHRVSDLSARIIDIEHNVQDTIDQLLE